MGFTPEVSQFLLNISDFLFKSDRCVLQLDLSCRNGLLNIKHFTFRDRFPDLFPT
jgi:hypothetical protein